MAGVVSVASLIVILAIIATVVAHPTSATILQAMGNTFTGSITAAEKG